MATYRILHCADLHLDSPLRGLEADPDAPADRIRGATRAAFTNLVDFALDQNVAVVLIAGDLYDGDWQDWRTGQFLIRELQRLTRAGIQIVAISGNHDAESVITRKLRWPDRATLLATARAETVTFAELGLAVHGRGFPTKAVTETLLPSYPPPSPGLLNIGLLHTCAAGRAGHERYAPCTAEQLAAHGYDYWALGHIHAREILCRDPWVVFPGNLQGRHVGEEGAKGAMLITVEDGKIVGEPSHHALDVVRWRRLSVDLTGAADEDAALALVRGELAAALGGADGRMLAVRLTLTGATAALAANQGEMFEKIRGEALAAGGGGALWLERVVIETTPPAAPAPVDPTIALLLQSIDDQDPAALLADLQGYAAQLLDRAPGLRAALGDDHPATRVAAGEVSAALLAQARALLLAKLGA
ncbi:MAG: DNA repair exonuclease [Rhodospirillales bacterium]